MAEYRTKDVRRAGRGAQWGASPFAYPYAELPQVTRYGVTSYGTPDYLPMRIPRGVAPRRARFAPTPGTPPSGQESFRNAQEVRRAKARGDAALRKSRAGSINYFNQYSDDPRTAVETKARIDALRRWNAGERFTPRTTDARFKDGQGRTVIGRGGFSYKAANEARAKGKGVASVTFGEGGDAYTTTSIGDALATARRIGDNNQRRGRLIGMLTKMGASREDLSTLYKAHKGLQGLDISGDERAAVSTFLKGARRKVTDEFWTSRRNIQGQRDALTGPKSKTDAMVALLKPRERLKGLSSGFGGAVEGTGYAAMLTAAGNVAATVAAGTGSRARNVSSGSGSTAMVFNEQSKVTSGGISSRGGLRARSTGGSLTDLGGGSGTSASNPAVAFRNALQTAIGNDPGGGLLGYDPKGNPIFRKRQYGGNEYTSSVEKDYKRGVYEYNRDLDRAFNDSIMSGGAGAQLFSNRRIMKALDRANYANDTRYVRAIDAMTDVARLAGLRPGEFGFQSAPESPEPAKPGRLQVIPQDEQDEVNEVAERRRAAHPEEGT